MSPKENLPPAAERLEIVDPFNCQVAFADWVATVGYYGSVVNLTLGALDHAIPSDNGQPRIVVVSRLRFTREVGLQLHSAFGRLLDIAPPSQPGAPEAPPIPKNQIN